MLKYFCEPTYKTNVVFVGVEINEITDLDFKKLTHQLDFYLWFRFQGDMNTQNIKFFNAAEPINIGEPIAVEKVGFQTRHLYRIKGRFKVDFLPNRYAYEQHTLGISFYSSDLTRHNRIYVTDILGIGLTKRELLERMQNAQILSPIYDWSINNVLLFPDIISKHSLGSLKVQKDQIKYSRFNAAVPIQKNDFTLRRTISPNLAKYILILSCIMLILITLYSKLFSYFYKPLWFFQIFLVFLVLLSSEVILIDTLMFDLTRHHLKTLIMTFDVLWWIMPAFFLNLLVNRFLWIPLEERTGRAIPNVVRRFMATIIYLLACFGIIAFVYEKPLTSLLATSGVVAMIIGLAIQVNISNVFSGIVINLERPFRVDDWVKIQIGRVISEGRVVDITWRTTRISTQDGYILSIPNSAASEAIVHNYNYLQEPCRVSLKLRIDHAHFPEKVEKILLDAVLSTVGVLNKPSPSADFAGFSDWAADYSVSFYVSHYAQQSIHKKQVWKRIWIHLHRAGILPAVQRQEIYTFKGVKEKGREEAIKPMALLQEIDVFQPFSEQHKAYLSEQMRHYRFSASETIFHQGDEGSNSLFIIVEGVVSIYVRLENDQTLEVARLGAGNFFGEMALLKGQERTATVIAMTEVCLYEIIKSDILPLLQEQPQVLQRINNVLNQRQMNTDQMKLPPDLPIEKEVIHKWIFRGILNFFSLGK